MAFSGPFPPKLFCDFILSVGQGRCGEKLQSGVGRELGTDGGRALLQRDDTEKDAGEEEVCFLDLY